MSDRPSATRRLMRGADGFTFFACSLCRSPSEASDHFCSNCGAHFDPPWPDLVQREEVEK